MPLRTIPFGTMIGFDHGANLRELGRARLSRKRRANVTACHRAGRAAQSGEISPVTGAALMALGGDHSQSVGLKR